MDCFLGCFKGPKERKRLKKSKRSSPVDKLPQEKGSCNNLLQSYSPEKKVSAAAVEAAVEAAENASENPVGKISENQEQRAVANVRKKVTFDLNVTMLENVPVHEEPNYFSYNGGFEREVKEEEDMEEEEEEEESNVSPKLVTYFPNHRYQNCESSDDEGLNEEEDGEGEEDEELNFDEEGDDIGNEESYDSYFSLPMEGEKKNIKEVSSPNPIASSATNREQVVAKANVRDRSTYIHCVLNPVENLSHWKEAKVRVAATFKNLSKENIDLNMETESFISPEPTLKAQKPQKPISSNPYCEVGAKLEITIDASLSNWLVSPNCSRLEPEKSNSILSNSSFSQEERPILGALTIVDINQASKTASPRSSPSRRNEEIPIVGTVGSYWSSKSNDSASSWNSASENRGIPNTTSKYREDNKVNWHSTPFETRLERALCEQS